MSLNESSWLTEIYDGSTAFSVKYSGKLFDRESEFQRVEVFDTPVLGKVLILGGCFMVTEKDHFIYHEMLVHPAMSCLRSPKHALVIGGGDGGAITELAKYPGLESLTLCEIDPMVIDTCREYFPEVSKGLNDPRVTIVTRDGAAFVSEFRNHFDAIFVDSTDPVGPGEALFRTSFFESIKSALTQKGVAVFQTESPLFMANVYAKAVSDLRSVFGLANATPYVTVIPTYPGAMWSFTFCSETVNPLNQNNAGSAPSGLSFYTEAVHKGAFALPPFASKLIK